MKTFMTTLGNMAELRKSAEAHLMLQKPIGWDIKIIQFATRKQLEAFNKKSNLHALVKTPVKKGCKLYNHEVEEVIF